MSKREEIIQQLLPKMAKLQRNLQEAISGKESGRHQLVVQLNDGEISRVQIFTEDSEDMTKDKSTK